MVDALYSDDHGEQIYNVILNGGITDKIAGRLAVRYDGSAPAATHGYQVHVGPMYSDSRGSVKIRSANPMDKLRLVFNYLSTPTDRQEWLEAIRITRQILNQPAMSGFNDRPEPRVAALRPRPPVESCTIMPGQYLWMCSLVCPR